LVLLAEGFEEVEAVTPIDYLRRSGIDLTTAAIGSEKIVAGSHKIPVVADALFAAAAGEPWDAVILPGGGLGAKNLAASREAGAFLQAMAAAGKIVAAICASPAVVLAPLGLLKGKRYTCYPGMEEQVSGAFWCEEPAVTDGNIITSRGAGTAADFSLALISRLAGEDEAQKLARSVVLQ
jgi:4-methyl-5(b-hydroxyethyl)-thiazole monophosphate biosynthesis